MNNSLKKFVEQIILEGVGREFMGTGCIMSISHEYASDVDVSEYLEEAISIIKGSGINLHGWEIGLICHECEVCREYNSMYPYHVELITM